MHAVVLHTFGPAENLRYETVEDPVPGPGQVRIAVKAAGVHHIETVMRAGGDGGMAPPLPELPAIFGGEVAGVVDAVGSDVDASWVGRDVVTRFGTPGGYAELAVADVGSVRVIPDGLDHQAAVAMVVTGFTALALLHVAELTPEDVVLVTSAAGGIGRLVVQYARNLGATVIGAAGGPAKVQAVRELGADIAVDYNEPGWAKTLEGVTVVLDGVGGDKAQAAYDRIVPGGRFVSIGNASRQEFTPDASRDVTVTNALLMMIEGLPDAPDFEGQALAAAAEGTLVPTVQAFPLSQAAAAHAALASRATTGKVVLVP
ncbi:NADPH2:quinone reductase [Kibdelosporangium banguiense]|uniref:NADPH2:quinone reductase n=1 Tax=Kibdelosporangium banguiense TaxID=1365924 RepID=A0ABS4TT74_9PSEU|nr:zinc-binding dehydrogenase [Kibdelosporangium banguiense]MBP2327586.1 NADPH2:quinone reductase [Kibdelosporangium banguiense]